ncbi:MAG TPA: rod shape-determining protein MreC [Mycobacteriales bacterium]|nr:rod shape-determining protein MreC [Mycobacteriales bacterium]
MSPARLTMRDSPRLRVVLALLLLTSFTLITLDYKAGRGGPFGGVRNGISTLLGPVQRGLGSVFSPVSQFVGDLAHAGRDGQRVRDLRGQVAALQTQLRGAGDITRESKELAGLVTLSGAHQFSVVPARVVAVGGISGFDFAATLNVGSRDGIRPDLTVINGEGLVGRVLTVTPYTCTVALAIDPNVKIGARLQRDAQIGIADGHGLAPQTFTPTDPTLRPKAGDIVETFGSTVFAPGVPLGTVTSVAPTPGKTTLTAQVRPFVDYTALDVVGVIIQDPRTRPATATLPPRPTVTVTVTAPPAAASPTPQQSGAPATSSGTPATSSGTPGTSSGAGSTPTPPPSGAPATPGG